MLFVGANYSNPYALGEANQPIRLPAYETGDLLIALLTAGIWPRYYFGDNALNFVPEGWEMLGTSGGWWDGFGPSYGGGPTNQGQANVWFFDWGRQACYFRVADGSANDQLSMPVAASLPWWGWGTCSVAVYRGVQAPTLYTGNMAESTSLGGGIDALPALGAGGSVPAIACFALLGGTFGGAPSPWTVDSHSAGPGGFDYAVQWQHADAYASPVIASFQNAGPGAVGSGYWGQAMVVGAAGGGGERMLI